MPQTKTSPRRGTSSRSSRSGSTARASKSRSAGRSASGRAPTRSGSSVRKQPNARARDAVSSGDQNAAQGAVGVIKKAKMPLIAGGAAIVGLAGAAALNARASRRTVLGVKLPKRNGLAKVDARKIPGAVSDAAKRADRFGQRVSSVASSVQMVSETADKATKKA